MGRELHDKDVVQLEGFVRGRLWRDLFLTVSSQLVRNSGFDGSGLDFSRTLFLPGLRLSYAF